ncbi:helix-turn-helix transcriptional regulator [Litorisediminicola beolgyonensis]|uniref:AraC family transcriptional regulator n=1 Tax=Litorisediminicola beolgyonensis TaxID=1173614 RepID=A0ABW3ZFR7_9RHOB
MATGPGFLRRPARIQEPGPLVKPVTCLPFGPFCRGQPWRMAELHDRQTDLLVWMTRGQGRAVINGLRRGFGAHGALFLPAGTLFSVEPGAQAYLQVIEAPKGLLPQPVPGPLLLRVRDSLGQAELTACFEAMQRETAYGRTHLQDALRAHLGLVGVWLRRQFEAGATDRPPDNATTRLARRFAHLVVADFRTDRAMAEYAEALGVTATHLTRTCRAACGKTASEIITERKLYEAKLMLGSAGPPIQEVARTLGFNSAAYFTRFIQNHTGLSPSALRKRAQTASHVRGPA